MALFQASYFSAKSAPISPRSTRRPNTAYGSLLAPSFRNVVSSLSVEKNDGFSLSGEDPKQPVPRRQPFTFSAAILCKRAAQHILGGVRVLGHEFGDEAP